MSKYKAVLFDADGVAILPHDNFSEIYAKRHGIDIDELELFFDDDFFDCMKGEKDIKKLIDQKSYLWRLEGTADELLDDWCETENLPNTELLAVIKDLGAKGIKCYLATNQEAYRTEYLEDVMFDGIFNDIFSSSSIGAMKPEPEFYEFVLAVLAAQGIGTSEIIYFDDCQKAVDAATSLGIESRFYAGVDQVIAETGVSHEWSL